MPLSLPKGAFISSIINEKGEQDGSWKDEQGRTEQEDNHHYLFDHTCPSFINIFIHPDFNKRMVEFYKLQRSGDT